MKLAVALLLLAASSAQAAYNIAECATFFALGFDILDFDRYDVFFRSTSTYALAPAGTFQGPEAIEEYVKFGSSFSPYVGEFDNIHAAFDIDATRFDATTGTCAFWYAHQSNFKMSAPAFSGLEGEVATLNLIQYKIDGDYVSHVELYFQPGWYPFGFGSALNTDGVRKYICEVMRDSCSTTWAANRYDSTGLAKCIDDLESLPMLYPPPYFDGKGQACRFMHADFAAENSEHCPHISLIPIEDVNGKTVDTTVKKYFEGAYGEFLKVICHFIIK